MSHPCLVTLDSRSAPRVLFAGDRLVEVALPAGTRVLYPKPPRPELPDLERAVRDAIEAPFGQQPLEAQLRPGMRVTIAVDDASHPPASPAEPDPRGRVLRVLLEVLDKQRVVDVEVVVATGLRRNMTRQELSRMLGERTCRQLTSARLLNHDPERGSELVAGVDGDSKPILLNRRAAQSDLLIYLSVWQRPGEPLEQRLLEGLRGYEPAWLGEALTGAVRRWPSQPNVFALALVANTRRYAAQFGFLDTNEDELSGRQRWLLQAALAAGQRLPPRARQAAWVRARSSLQVQAVFAGSLSLVDEHVQRRCAEQCAVPLERQADVLVTGVPPVTRFNGEAFINPLLVSAWVRTHLLGLSWRAPLVRRGGTVILLHPCTDRFDHAQHPAHRDFVHRILPETNDVDQLRERYEHKFVRNPALLAMFRQGAAYHPAHPFVLWYWGQAAKQYLDQVIVVGADNEYIPHWLGFQTAPSVEAALYRARQRQPREAELLCLHAPELSLGDVEAVEAGA